MKLDRPLAIAVYSDLRKLHVFYCIMRHSYYSLSAPGISFVIETDASRPDVFLPYLSLEHLSLERHTSLV